MRADSMTPACHRKGSHLCLKPRVPHLIETTYCSSLAARMERRVLEQLCAIGQSALHLHMHRPIGNAIVQRGRAIDIEIVSIAAEGGGNGQLLLRHRQCGTDQSNLSQLGVSNLIQLCAHGNFLNTQRRECKGRASLQPIL